MLCPHSMSFLTSRIQWGYSRPVLSHFLSPIPPFLIFFINLDCSLLSLSELFRTSCLGRLLYSLHTWVLMYHYHEVCSEVDKYSHIHCKEFVKDQMHELSYELLFQEVILLFWQGLFRLPHIYF